MVNDFQHIFVVNPSINYDFKKLIKICKTINFPLYQIYIIGDNYKIKKKCRQYFLPYFLSSYTSFIAKYSKLFRLKQRFFIILNRYNDLFDIDFTYVTHLHITSNLYGFYTTQDYVFDYLYSKGFKNTYIKKINHFQNESLWQQI